MKNFKFALAFLLVFAALFTACLDSFIPQNKVEAGYGRVQINIDGFARTVYPNLNFDEIVYKFGKDTDTPAPLAAANGYFTLELGNWTVQVEATIDDELVAAGEKIFTLSAEEVMVVNVSLEPVTVDYDDGAGTFKFNISVPSGADIVSITLKELTGDLWAGSDISAGITNVSGAISGTISDVPTGFYLFTIQLKVGSAELGRNEVIHIYNGMTSEYGKAGAPVVFTSDDFISEEPKPITGVIVKDLPNAANFQSKGITVADGGAITLFTSEARYIQVTLEAGELEGEGDITWSATTGVTLGTTTGEKVLVTGGSSAATSTVTISAENDDNVSPVVVTFTVNVKTRPTTASGWTTASGVPSTEFTVDMAVGNGVMVIITGSSAGFAAPGKIFWTENGTSWTQAKDTLDAFISAASAYRSVTYGFVGGKNQFVAVGNSQIATSDDGKVWTLGAGGGSSLAVAAGNNMFVTAGISTVQTSTNGTTFAAAAAAPITFNGRGITFGNNTFVIVGDGGNVRYSSNLTQAWNSLTAGTGALQRVAFGNGVFVASGNDTAFFSIDNGVSWNQNANNANGGNIASSRVVTFDNGYFAAFDTNVVRFSSNGIDWQTSLSFSGLTTALGGSAIGFIDGKWVVAANSGAIQVSP